MSFQDYIKLIARKKRTLLSILAIFFIASLIFTVIQPFQYKSSIKLLVIQNFSQDIDPYAASKSNEYLSDILAKIAYSDYFLSQVLNSDDGIDKNYFNTDIAKRVQKWKKTISINPVENTGIIAVDVFHSDKAQAEEIVRAIGRTMKDKNSDYHGYGENVIVKIIEGPITSKYPARPDLILNFGLAFILGLIFGLNYIYLFPEERYDIKISLRRKQKADGVQAARQTNNVLPPEIFANDEFDLEYEDKSEFENKNEDYVKKLMDRNIISRGAINSENTFCANEDYENNMEEKTENKEIKGDMDNIFGQ